MGYLDERFVEYDLDSEDERWLDDFNMGQDRLPPRRLEYLLWRLELANAEATDRALSGAGALPHHAASTIVRGHSGRARTQWPDVLWCLQLARATGQQTAETVQWRHPRTRAHKDAVHVVPFTCTKLQRFTAPM